MVGVDTHTTKVALVGAGTAPIVELSASCCSRHVDAASAVGDSDLSIVCVGTSSRANGSLDTAYFERVCEDIGQALRETPGFHVVVVRSTVLGDGYQGICW